MIAATEKLRPLLGKRQPNPSWRVSPQNFNAGTEAEVLGGMVTLSPGWFQQGHEVSCLVKCCLSAADLSRGDGARSAAGQREFQIASCLGLAGPNLRIQCNFERNPGGHSSRPPRSR